MSSPAARGLFRQAVVQSGGAAAVCTLDDARLVAAELATMLGVPPTAEAFGALDPQAVVAAQAALAMAIQSAPDPQRWGASVLRGGLGIMSTFPVVDGDVVPDVPLSALAAGAAAGVPLLLGTTREEFRLFLVPTGIAGTVTEAALAVLAARYGWPAGAVETYSANRPDASPGDVAAAILTDAGFRAPTRDLATAQHGAAGAVHQYEFAWQTEVADLGASHALELPFVFDTLGDGGFMVGPGAPQGLADEMHAAWVRFVTDGDPGWPRWTPQDQAVMTFGTPSEVVRAPRADELALWP
jgi:para-nitrobenzyl esterase